MTIARNRRTEDCIRNAILQFLCRPSRGFASICSANQRLTPLATICRCSAARRKTRTASAQALPSALQRSKIAALITAEAPRNRAVAAHFRHSLTYENQVRTNDDQFAARRIAVLMACASLLQSPNSVATAAPENRTADVIIYGGTAGEWRRRCRGRGWEKP